MAVHNQSPQANRAKTGLDGLDNILHGGLIRHRLYLVDGNPGSGKTTLALQFLLEGVRNGEKCLYITLSETREELQAGAQSHGWTLDGIEIVEMISGDGQLSGDSDVTMYHPAEAELTETTKIVLDAVSRINPTRIVFDSLSELRLLAQSSLRYRRQILALKQFFIGRKCTVLLLDDRTSEGSDLQLHSIVHGVIALEQLSPVYGSSRRRLRVTKLRGTDYRGGYHDFTIRRGGLEIFPRLVAAEHHDKFAASQLKSGIEGLDSLLGGGPEYGTSNLLIGPAGSGKSTIAIQYATAAARQGEHAAIFSFEESIATMRARTSGMNIPLDQCISSGQLHVKQIDPAELSPGEFSHMVRQAVERDKVKVIVIDSLNGYMNAMPEENFLTAQLHELLSYLGFKGVTTFIVVAHQGLLGAVPAAPVDTSYLADSVILIRYFETRGEVHKAISVLKKRSGVHELTLRSLTFSKRGIEISPPLTNFRGILGRCPVESGGDEVEGSMPTDGG